MREIEKMSFETKCVHGAYKAESGQPQVLPIVQNTTYRYYDSKDVAELFDLDSPNFMYTRLGSPTVNALEEKMALLEGGTAGIAASSGMAASFITICNICQAGDHVISATNIYGGTHNLFGVSLKKLGIDVTFIDQDLPLEEILKSARPETKAIFGETIGNPALSVLDFEKFSKAAKTMGVPFIVDNTLASPALCRPIEHGADIVIQSTTKYADGHASCVGGVVVEAGTFDWAASGKFPGMVEPDESYHGLSFYNKFKDQSFTLRLRAVMLRDFGCTMAPMNAYLTHQGLQTLHLRMERHCENALALAEFLKNHEMTDWVIYPGLKGDKYYDLSQKYLPDGAGGVLCFGVKGGKAAGEKFLSHLKLTSIVVHVGDIRTSVLHPASTTHRQLSEEEQIAGGIRPELIRVSVGLESISDIKADFDQALKAVK
ncbi:O-acetylhomoserine aminocarboxypropyltransferase/cysteine synthase family protein [Aminipila terrae]|uniref:Bifunctional O-acetylhomoserine aminocarboxypropyltransferase/cysteine synthase n=1 Tax=Aminipila terrae TaxID=2697030 RepID=A0A6P1MIG3_9FIRM|nr:O-acetylhomoserine aminocarboxypropyltransferase/cysteine synthase family protein [Aminipila terrae]QHI71778.1 bifunctional O-acetylhomoserine aminocarboxypropyltransferase/cysteine synthase [Aminipila terrae]